TPLAGARPAAKRSKVVNSVRHSLPPRPRNTRIRPGWRSSGPSESSIVKASGNLPAVSRTGATTFISCPGANTTTSAWYSLATVFDWNCPER
ncbi:MAG: hypothetical protein RL479_1582, partial [Verrucomicrobiota bacterium]